MSERKMPTLDEATERAERFLERERPVWNERAKKRHELQAYLKNEHGDDYDRTVAKFEVNKAERAVIDKWLEELKPEIMAIQGKGPFNDDEPYYGTIGGGLTYSFVGTGIGTILTVKETTTGKELNVTQALDWFFFG